MNDQQDSDDLRAQLEVLRGRLRQDTARVADLRAVVIRQSLLERLVGDLDRQLARVQRAAVITLVGATGAGKSTLLNALVGSSVAEEGVDRPTTRRPVIYAPADVDVEELLSEAITQPEGRESEGAPVVVRHSAWMGPWAAQILIDAPDLNSIDEQHRATVTALAERSDVLVVVLHHQSVIEEASVSFVDAYAARRCLVFVLNRADELTAEARDAVLAQIRQLASGRWQAPNAPVLAISARDAQSQPNAQGWAEFCRVLQDLVRESAITGVRRTNAIGTAARLQAVFAAVRDEVEEDLAALPGEVTAGLDALVDRTAEEVGVRLAVRRADLKALLLGEAAKRWEGPGGWVLRSGGTTPLGLAAGAMLMGRSAILAAGTAAGAVAADQARHAMRDRRVADTSALMPTHGEFESWYVEALAPARVRAARLTGATEGMGVPTAAAAHQATGAAVEEAWRRLVERDLPQAAERSLLRFFRVVLDLPVYTLGLWVLFQVATGFVSQDYVGVDFLVNGGLLLAAYLFGVRLIVSAGLGLRARRLLEQVTRRSRDALGQEARGFLHDVQRATAEHAECLERFGRLEESWRAELGGRG